MRFLSATLIFLAFGAVIPRDSFELRTRYGEPNLERFTIRPGITMTAEYGADGRACVLDIQPRKDSLRLAVADETLSMDTVTSVLDEVVPPGTRGKENMRPFSAVMSGSCNSGMTFADYDNMQINLVYGFCATPIGVHSATVHFKRAVCENRSQKGK